MLKIYFETYGCTANYNSTEIMQGLLLNSGFEITSDIKKAYLIVINSCIVKDATEQKIKRKIQDLLKQKRKIILAGCMPKFVNKSFNYKNLFLLDTNHIKEIIELVKDIKNHSYQPKKYLSDKQEIKLAVPKNYKDILIGITQISEGCLGKCSYCITRFAKGTLFSYPIEKIINSVKKDIKNGCKEIYITSQDNAAYGNEKGKYLLPELLKNILSLEGNFFVRLGMMNPNNVLKILPELIEIYKNPKMFKFLHIPVQSGSNKILKAMNRGYNVQEFLKIVNDFKKNIPKITISTDIIVGFPGEKEDDFLETIGLIKNIEPEILNRSNFSKRKGTLAESLSPINSEEMNKRAKKLSELHLQICNKKQKLFLGKSEKVLIDKKGFKNTYLGRNKDYKLFAVNSKKDILGKIINIKINKAMPHYLLGKII